MQIGANIIIFSAHSACSGAILKFWDKIYTPVRQASYLYQYKIHYFLLPITSEKRNPKYYKYLCLYWTFISISGNIKIHDWIIIHNQQVQIANRNLNFKLSSLALFDKDFAFQLYEPELINDPWIICNLKLKTVSAAGHNTQ